ncbi:hypothetical protein GW17_00022015 [Ensete ventricosum]|nr:hypothetical protein GW17_00022015 [Ensete ventricosum]
MYIAAPSSSYYSRTLAATDATCSHEVAVQSQLTLLLPSSSSTIAATLGCHPPLGDFTPTRTEAKKIIQEMQEIQIIRPQPSLAMIFYLQKLYLFVYKDKLFLKCHIQLNQLWFLMQYSLISGYFHDFIGERTMMLKVFPNDDLRSTAYDRKKEQEKGIHMTPTAMMPYISMLALPERDNLFVLGANISRVGISVTLMQDGPWHETGVSPKELQFMLTLAYVKKK